MADPKGNVEAKTFPLTVTKIVNALTWEAPARAIALSGSTLSDSECMMGGESFKDRFPATAAFHFNPDFKRNTLLVDCLVNVENAMVCSLRLADFIRGKTPDKVEYLPVTVFDISDRSARPSEIDQQDEGQRPPVVASDDGEGQLAAATTRGDSWRARHPNAVTCVTRATPARYAGEARS